MSQKLRTVCGQFREELSSHGVKLVRLARRHAVPHLGRPRVQVVDTIEIQILFMPRKKRLPHAKVGHRCGDPANLRHVVRLPQAPQIPQIPAKTHLVIEQRHDRIRAVYRRVERHPRPEGPLHQHVLVVLTHPLRRLPVLLVRQHLVLRCRHLPLLLQQRHIRPRPPEHVLLDWRIDPE